MTRYEKLVVRLLSGSADRSFRFDDLCSILRRVGFEERRRGGSHHIFFRTGIAEILNLQPRASGEAKPYQVRQVRDIVIKYRLTDTVDQERENDA